MGNVIDMVINSDMILSGCHLVFIHHEADHSISEMVLNPDFCKFQVGTCINVTVPTTHILSVHVCSLVANH